MSDAPRAHADDCPPADQWRAWAAGTLPAPVWEALDRHLEQCHRCEQVVSELGNLSDFQRQIALHLADGLTDGPALDCAVAALSGGPTPTLPTAGLAAVDLAFLSPGRPGALGRLAHYEVLEVLGRGGMGVVFKAFDTRLERVVAIKVIAPDLAGVEAARTRFLREARAVAAIRHPSVIDIYAVDEFNGTPYFVMGFVPGLSLQELLNRDGPLPARRVIAFGREIARGLEAAHARGLIHRDIKPANVLIDGDSGRALITDFGLVLAAGEAAARVDAYVAGTPHYMSPEHAAGGPLDERADLFSLGSVLYAMCVGRPPFDSGSPVSIIQRLRAGPPPPVTDVDATIPQGLAEVIARLHAYRPQDRFVSAGEVAAALDRLAAGETHVLDAPAKRRRLPRVKQLLLAVVAASALALVGWWPGMLSREPAVPTQPVADQPRLPPRILAILPATDFYGPDYFPVAAWLIDRGGRVVTASWSPEPATPAARLPGFPVKPDVVLADVRAADYDALFFVGGTGVEQYVGKGPGAAAARRLIAEAVATDKVIAATGMAPVILAEAGVLKGKQATCFRYGEPPGRYITRLEAAGATWLDQPAVVSGKIITGNDPGTIREFARTLATRLGLPEEPSILRQQE